MLLTRLLPLKLGTLVFLFILMLHGYCRSPALFFSIHLLSFNVAIEALLAHHLHDLYLAKSHVLALRLTALFSLSASILMLYFWVVQAPS